MSLSESACPSILLVDDRPANLVALEAVLEPLKLRAVRASSGAEAISHVERESFAVILLDVQMPAMDGFETAKRIRALANGRDTPIIFLTAVYTDDEYAQKGYAAGGVDFMTKPFDAPALRARVGAFADLLRHRQRLDRSVQESSRKLASAERRLAAFERISTAALETDEVEPFLHTLLTVFLDAADGAETATIALRRDDELRVCASIGLAEEVEAGVTIPVGQGFTGAIAATGRPLLLTGDAIGTVAVSRWLRQRGLSAVYGVPLVHESEVIGVAHIGSTFATRFTEAEERLLLALADRAAWAVARQGARRRLYAVLQAAPALVSTWSRGGASFVRDFANVMWRRVFDEVALGATPPVLPPFVLDAFDAVMRSGESISFDEITIPAAGGSETRFNVLLSPLRDVRGRPEAVLAFGVDVTAQVRARDAQRRALEQAEAANRAKDEFLATVSHELRTPLTAILGWTLNARRNGAADVGHALDVIERNARAQVRLVEDVLDLARVASGKLALQLVPTDLSRAIFLAVESVRPVADSKPLELRVQVDQGLGLVYADPDRIQQIVSNLLNNAVKFTPPSGRVDVLARRFDARVVISVRDTGQGIAPEFLAHVFDPFQQGDASTTRRHKGLGLGLAIVQQLVRAHGGSVRAESAGEGRGATFTVELLPVPVLVTPRPKSKSLPPPANAATLRGLRVLIVEDEADARALLSDVLSAHGATVDLAASASEGLDRVTAFRPDILVSDIAMPSVDGYTLLRRVRQLAPELGGRTPAVALTAHARAEDVERARIAGFQQHIAKPVDPEQLVALLGRLRPPTALPS
jgi:signal transduction histidine kinase/DNA-binding response OmpR family regulator